MSFGEFGDGLPDMLAQRLFDQRVVLLRGTLDARAATRASAELMTLDAQGDEAVTLRIDCGSGSLAEALTLMDVIELLGVPVRALCLGQVGAAAIGVLSVTAERSALPSTRFSLKEPATSWQSSARDVAQLAQLRADERERFCARLAAAIAQSAQRVGDDLAKGVYLGAQEALDYGIIDEIRGHEAQIHQLGGAQMGFRPRP